MNSLKSLIKNPTFFSIASLLGIIIFIPLGFYGLTLKGGASLYGVFFFGIAFGFAILFAVDRVLAIQFSTKLFPYVKRKNFA